MNVLDAAATVADDADRRWIGGVLVSGVLAYAVLFLLNVAMIVFVAYLESLHGLSVLERSELHQIATFGGVRFTVASNPGLIPGQTEYVTGYYHAGNEDMNIWMALSGLAYAATSYLSASTIAEYLTDDRGSPADDRESAADDHGYVTTAAAVAVPFAAVALWRALAFGTRVSYGDVYTAVPVRTLVGALVFALAFGTVGGALARWRRG